MADWLIGVGRALVGWCAAAVVVAVGAVAGFRSSEILDVALYGGGMSFANVDALTVTPGRFVGLLIGAAIGFVVAAATLGLAAAVFDIQRTLRLIAARDAGAGYVIAGDEPRGAARRRAEPQLDAPV